MVIKTYIFIILYLILLNNCFANNSVNNSNKYVYLNSLLEEQKYDIFYNEIKKSFNNQNDKLSYLQKHINSGHPIIYYEISNIYSTNILQSKYHIFDKNLINNARYYFYIGHILLKQDSNTCLNMAIRTNNVIKYYEYYPNILDFENKYKLKNKEIFNLSLSFVNQLKTRPNYFWPCFNIDKKISTYGQYFNKNEVINIRKQTNESLKTNFK